MKILIFFLLVLIIPIGFSNVDATILENKSLIGSDIKNETFLTLKFNEDFVLHKKILPQIESGELTILNEKIDLKKADIHYMANGNALVIKSLSNDLKVIMYARTTSTSNYLINTYILTDNFSHKVQMKAKIVDESQKSSSSSSSWSNNTEIHFVTSHYEKVYNNNDFKFSVKVFDKSVYSGNNFDSFKGKLNGVKVSAVIIDPNGKIKKIFSGLTENGIFEGVINIPENLWVPGWYTVNLEIEKDENFERGQLTFYVFGKPPPNQGG